MNLLKPIHLKPSQSLLQAMGLGLSIGLIACWSSIATAQVVLSPSTPAAGGGSAASARYQLQGLIGQTAASTSQSSRFRLSSGYWSGVVMIQNPEAPLLSIRRDPIGPGLILAWPIKADSWVLQEKSNPNAATPWIDVRAVPEKTGDEFIVRIQPISQARYFQLRASTK